MTSIIPKDKVPLLFTAVFSKNKHSPLEGTGIEDLPNRPNEPLSDGTRFGSKVRALRDRTGDLWVEVVPESDHWFCITTDNGPLWLSGDPSDVDPYELPTLAAVTSEYGPVREV
jgi:hypothetical protein